MFDPMDERWWRRGADLAWWDSALGLPPAWLPERDEARAFLERNRTRMLRAVGLLMSYRTLTTEQAHRFDKSLPASPEGGLWTAMAALGLIDLGWPTSPDGRIAVHPRKCPFMAVRVTRLRDVSADLRHGWGFTPVELASVGPTPWRGARQYDRHNLITTEIALTARAQGWTTAGEMWNRFQIVTGDDSEENRHRNAGSDLALIGERVTVCVETCASVERELGEKMDRWDDQLAKAGMNHVHVVWLEAGRGENVGTIRRGIDRLCADRPRHHAGAARDWLDGRLACADGFAPAPGHAPDPSGWMRRDLRRIGSALGFPNADRWRLPPRLEGAWWG